MRSTPGCGPSFGSLVPNRAPAGAAPAGAMLALLLAAVALAAVGCSDSNESNGSAAVADGALGQDGFGFGGQSDIQNGTGTGTSDGQGGGVDGAGVDEDSIGGSRGGLCEFAATPSKGEPGAPCTQNEDCDSTVCVDGPDGRICTRTCEACCPHGFACENWDKKDTQFICLPKFAALCRPCMDDSECEAVNTGALCIPHDDGGAFCGGACDATADCPIGYACEKVKGTKGTAMQCVRKQGQCTCSAKAAADGASTYCSTSNQFGTCQGQRTCSIDGLGPCVGPSPAPETCNAMDDNCDGQTDEGLGGGEPCSISNTFGSCTGSTVCNGGAVSCVGPEPAAEVCNGKDDDCDGKTDEDSIDLDLDGIADCVDDDIDGDKIPNANDCAPNDASIAPGLPESCNGKDDDCDGQIDEVGATGCTVAYADVDKDGYGDGAKQACVCGSDPNFPTTKAGDCNDIIATIHPDASEACDGGDNDCDGQTDEGFSLGAACDSGVGACKSFGQMVCSPDGKSVVCSAGAQQGGVESCNGKDDDCNGQTDEGFGVGSPCVAGKGVCAVSGTTVCGVGGIAICSATPKTGSAEKCDGLDNDCNGQTDEGCDDDLDGYCDKGMPFVNSLACAKGQGDCDDTLGTIHPGGVEVCNNKDDDCDGKIDAITEDCSNGCGAGSKTCNAGSWGACSAPTPKCTSGACCDGCNFKPATTKCGTSPASVSYSCSGACGGNVTKNESWAYCTGSSATCGTTNLKTSSAGVVKDCVAGELCQASGSSYSCKACSGGCSGSTCSQQPAYTICIDPQFGGSSPGACYFGACTKDLNLDIAIKLKAWLDKDTGNTAGGGNWKVVMTRTGDTDPSAAARTATCNNAGSDRVVSIAVNAYTLASVKGMESYYYKSSALGFCTTLHDEVVAATGFSNRGVKTSNFAILKDTSAANSCFPAPGFLSNSADAALIKDANFRNNNIAKGMLYGLQKSFGYAKFAP